MRRGFLGGVVAVVAVLAVVLLALMVYRAFFGLPSIEDDQAKLESALPAVDEVPPGLIPGDESGLGGFQGTCYTTAVEPRAVATVTYYESEGNLGEEGFFANAGSWESTEAASKEVTAADQEWLDRCFSEDEGFSAKTTTGGVEGADSSTVFIVEGSGGQFYAAVAQRDRFVVITIATDADRTLDLAADVVKEL